MKITISKTKPMTKPIREYETRILYVGRSRYNTHTKTISILVKHPEGDITYEEFPSETDVLSQVYSSEHVRVTVYSESPKIWCEETAPDEYYVFTEVAR
jgi:hypothetical protein